jgi:hypothetical protein
MCLEPTRNLHILRRCGNDGLTTVLVTSSKVSPYQPLSSPAVSFQVCLPVRAKREDTFSCLHNQACKALSIPESVLTSLGYNIADKEYSAMEPRVSWKEESRNTSTLISLNRDFQQYQISFSISSRVP